MKYRWFTFFLLLGVSCLSCQKQPPKQKRIRPVLTETISLREKKAYLLFSGIAKPKKKIQVSFRVSGQVAEFPVKTGEKLSHHQLIAKLDDHDYALQTQQMTAACEEAQAKLKEAHSHYKRLKLLYESASVSLQELEHASALYDSAKALADQVTSKLDSARKEQSYTLLKGNKGIWEVVAKHVEVHENVSAGQPVATLISSEDLQVEVAVPESEIESLHEGMAIDLTFSVYPEEMFQGTVDTVGISSTENTTFPVTISLTQQDKRLRPGMAVKARMVKPDLPLVSTTWVPLEAIGHDESGSFVYLFEAGMAKKTAVKLGELSTEGIEVISGLTPGQEVIVAGIRYLSNEQEVKRLEKP